MTNLIYVQLAKKSKYHIRKPNTSSTLCGKNIPDNTQAYLRPQIRTICVQCNNNKPTEPQLPF